MTSISRRNLLRAGVAGGVAGLAGGSLFEAPAFSSAGLRPLLTHGVQSGDATADSAIVWGRADRPARLWVQAGRRPDLRGARLIRGPVVTPDTDFTGKVRLRNLPSDSKIYYRVRAESLDRPGLFGSAVPGSLSTAPTRRRDIRFVWTGDVVGQGWGIDPAYGGLALFESMRRRRPDFLLHSGDSVYADGPLVATVVPGRRLPALRRGGDRRTLGRVDRLPPGPRRCVAVVDHAAPIAGEAGSPARQLSPARAAKARPTTDVAVRHGTGADAYLCGVDLLDG